MSPSKKRKLNEIRLSNAILSGKPIYQYFKVSNEYKHDGDYVKELIKTTRYCTGIRGIDRKFSNRFIISNIEIGQEINDTTYKIYIIITVKSVNYQ